ncbi:transient receptor potential cation channel protein painless-like [Periplaneta americana]|uniref:transient receptor potential cation channel protein painless-like n=1 Tax=Periplaneta americana TaxID=6978 RepID=UPI0037E78EA9
MTHQNGVNSHQKNLIEYLKAEKLTGFTLLLKDKGKYGIDPNKGYEGDGFKNCLAIAAERGLVEFIKVLLDNEANADEACEQFNNNAAIHFATENGKLTALKALVEDGGADINAVNENGDTALHIAVDKSEECFSYLLKLENIDISKTNSNSQTAIQKAIDTCNEKILSGILKRRDVSPEDRNAIMEKYPALRVESPDSDNAASYVYSNACKDLRNSRTEKVKELFLGKNVEELGKFINATDTGTEETLLQIACHRGQLDIVRLLIEFGADVNETGEEESRSPIYLACYFGQSDVLECLIEDQTVNKIEKGQLLLHAVIKGNGAYGNDTNKDQYHKCFDFVLQKRTTLGIDINQGCEKYEHTALHAAVLENDTYYAKELLLSGAYIGSINTFNISPVHDIDPTALEAALNECIEIIKPNKKDNEKNEIQVEVNFNFLKPSAKSRLDRPAEGGERLNETLLEMHSLYYISRSKHLRHLLKHPVLLLFLELKWNRICMLLYLNILLYLLFVVFLTVYILIENSLCETFDQNTCNTQSLSYELYGIIFVIVLVLFLILIVWETVKFFMMVQKITFFWKLKNLLKIAILLTTVLIIIGVRTKIIVAICLFFAWTEITLQCDYFSTFAIYNEMFKRVANSYMSFLILYTPLIISFTCGFYELRHKQFSNESERPDEFSIQNNNNSSEENKIVDFYSNIFLALLKTVLMMTGEFDASTMSFEIGYYFVFLLFVFVITIVLMNLLSGLAVSDIQVIKDEAELVTYETRVECIHNIETSIASYLGSFIVSSCCEAIIGISVLPQLCLFSGNLSVDRLSITIKNKEFEIGEEKKVNFSMEEFRMGLNLDQNVVDSLKKRSRGKPKNE